MLIFSGYWLLVVRFAGRSLLQFSLLIDLYVAASPFRTRTKAKLSTFHLDSWSVLVFVVRLVLLVRVFLGLLGRSTIVQGSFVLRRLRQ